MTKGLLGSSAEATRGMRRVAGSATQATLGASSTTTEEGQDGGAVADCGSGWMRTHQTHTPNTLAMSLEALRSDLCELRCWLRYEGRGVHKPEHALAAVASG